MNIYDFAGNMREQTLEKVVGSNVYCSQRGGNSNNNSFDCPASFRSDSGILDTDRLVGFRVALY